MKVTRKQILEIVPSGNSTDSILHYINIWADKFFINTPLRMAHFLAQVLHETSGFKYMKEYGDKTYFAKYEKGNLAKMLGNIQKGDGARYCGRGLMQLTGRGNYQAYKNSKFCTGDVVENPELLERPLGAVKSAMWFWYKNGCNRISDKDNIEAVTRKINGGINGLEDRKRWLGIVKKSLGLQ